MATEKQPFLQDLQARLGELLRSTPAADVERNVKALVGQAFQRLELVTRDELDACSGMLASLSARVAELERTVAALEQARAGGGSTAQAVQDTGATGAAAGVTGAGQTGAGQTGAGHTGTVVDANAVSGAVGGAGEFGGSPPPFAPRRD